MCRAPSKEVALKATHPKRNQKSLPLTLPWSLKVNQELMQLESKESYIFVATLQNSEHTTINTWKVSWKHPGVWTGGSGTSWNHSALVGGSLWFCEIRLLFWSSCLLIWEQKRKHAATRRSSKRVARNAYFERNSRKTSQSFPGETLASGPGRIWARQARQLVF